MDVPLAVYPALMLAGAGGLFYLILACTEADSADLEETPVVTFDIPAPPAGCEDRRLWARCCAIVVEEHIPLADAGLAVTEDVIVAATNVRYAVMLPVKKILLDRMRAEL